MAVTIKDVARAAGCSIKTVSRVVNDEPYVSEATRARVQKAIDELGYVPNIFARRFAQQRSYTLGVLLHSGGYNQQAWLSSILEIGYEYNYDILPQSYFPAYKKSQQKLASLIHERRIDGLVTTPPCDLDEFVLQQVTQSGIPLVCVNPYDRSGDLPYVSGDDFQGARMLTQHLMDLGHRRIAFFRGPLNHRMSVDRFHGYRAALEEGRLEYRAEWVQDSLFNFDGGYNATRMVMRGEDRPTAIFAGSDESAQGALFALREMGIEVPGEVSVAGFDDMPLAGNTWPGITTVQMPYRNIVEQAVNLLVDVLNKKDSGLQQVILPGRLILRGSTGPVPDPQG